MILISKKKIFLTFFLFIAPIILIFSESKEILFEKNFEIISGIYIYIYIILFLSSAFLSNSVWEDKISIRVIFWFYSYIFLSISPLYTSLHDEYLLLLSKKSFIIAIVIIILSNLFFEIGYNSYKKKLDLKKLKYNEININNLVIIIFLLFILTIILISIYGFEINTSIVRRIFNFSFTPFEEVIEFSYRTLPSILIIIFYYLKIKKNLNYYFLLLLLILNLLLIINPISGPRSLIFFLYFSILITYFYDLKIPLLMLFLLFVGIILSLFQLIAQTALEDGNYNLNEYYYVISRYPFSGHFDSFENITHTINYVIQNSSTYGHQLLGAIFFFVPREFWPDKPVGSGQFLTQEYLTSLTQKTLPTNISSPLIAEIILNFNFLLALLIFFIFGYFASKFDYTYKINKLELKKKKYKNKNYISFTLIFYPIFTSCFLFILRGDLLSGTAFTIGLLLLSYVYFQLLKKINNL